MTEVKQVETDHCRECKKETPVTELEENAQYGSYGFKPICDECGSRIDTEANQK